MVFITSIVLLDSLGFLALLRNHGSFCELQICLKKMIEMLCLPCFSNRNKNKVYLKVLLLFIFKRLLPKVFVRLTRTSRISSWVDGYSIPLMLILKLALPKA